MKGFVSLIIQVGRLAKKYKVRAIVVKNLNGTVNLGAKFWETNKLTIDLGNNRLLDGKESTPLIREINEIIIDEQSNPSVTNTPTNQNAGFNPNGGGGSGDGGILDQNIIFEINTKESFRIELSKKLELPPTSINRVSCKVPGLDKSYVDLFVGQYNIENVLIKSIQGMYTCKEGLVDILVTNEQ